MDSLFPFRSELRTPGQMEWIHDRFKIDGLERLARSTPDYYETHGNYLPDVAALAHAAIKEVERLRGQLKTARGIASGLFPMIDRATWQGAGGDDGQGHYEGEYWAEQMEQEIASWKAEDA